MSQSGPIVVMLNVSTLRLFFIPFVLVFSLSPFKRAFAEQNSPKMAILALDDFLQKAEESNLLWRQSQVMAEKSQAEAGSWRLPAPRLGLTQMDMADGERARGWEVSQQIPLPTKVYQDYQRRQALREAQSFQARAQLSRLRAEGRFLYYQVWQSQQKIKILNEKKALLKEHIAMSRSLSRSNTFAKIHLLKVEEEVDQADVYIKQQELTRQKALIAAAEFLNQEPEGFAFQAQDPGPPQPPGLAIGEAPQIESLRHELKSFQAQESLQAQAWWPDLDLRYSFMEEGAMFPQFQQWTVGVSLPFVFFSQAQSEARAGKKQRLQAELELRRGELEVRRQSQSADLSLSSLREQIEILEQRSLPRAQKRKRLFRNLSPRDLSSLQEHLETALALPTLHLQLLALREELETALATLQQYQSPEEINDARK